MGEPRWGRWWRSGGAFVDEGDDVAQGGVVAQGQAVVAFDVVGGSDGGEGLGLLHGVDAEVGFEVQVDVEQVGGVAGLCGHDGHDLLLDPVPGWRRGRGLGHGSSRRGRSFGDAGSDHRSGRGRRVGLSRRDRLRRRCDGRRRRTRHGWAVVVDPQRALGDLSDGRRQPAGRHQPRLPCLGVDDAVLEAELVRLGVTTGRGRHHPIQGHAHLRPEAGAEPQRVADGVRTTVGQVELSQLGVGHLVVRHRGHDPGFDRLDGDDVLDPDAHGMTGESLGVGDHHLTGRGAEDPPEGSDLGLRAASPRRRVGLVGDEHHGRRHLDGGRSPNGARPSPRDPPSPG